MISHPRGPPFVAADKNYDWSDYLSAREDQSYDSIDGVFIIMAGEGGLWLLLTMKKVQEKKRRINEKRNKNKIGIDKKLKVRLESGN